jgi:DNA-binding GntR family transcriptional regulator
MAADSGAHAQATPLRVLNRTPLRDQTVKALRDMVVAGVLGPGDRINEVQLAGQLGISRGPLREAIPRLAAEGFLEFRQNRGAFVRTVTLEDVRQMFEVREVIEVKAAMLAASRATAEGIAQLQELLSAADEVLHNDRSGPYPSHLDLHLLVLDLANSPYLQRIGADLQTQVQIARLKSGRSPERAPQALAEHRLVFSAIANRDVDGAARAMADHLQNSLKHLVTMAGRRNGAE